MSISRDSKGKEFPVWARYIEKIDASGSLSYTDGGGEAIPFAIYCAEEATATLKGLENSTAAEIVLSAGYHPIAVSSVTTTDVAIWPLFAYKPD